MQEKSKRVESGGSTRVRALIWDFDGTLVDSSEKNLRVTRSILRHVTGKEADHEALSSLASYRVAESTTENWRQLYAKEFRLSDAEIDEAGALWSEFQLREATEVPVFAGIPEVLRALRHLPHGVVSQNARAQITSVLEGNELQGYFGVVIGHEEVDFARQKPAPEGLLACLEELTGLAPGRVLYIGDHETDARCAARAKERLAATAPGVELISVGAFYGRARSTSWAVEPDHRVGRPQEILEILAMYG